VTHALRHPQPNMKNASHATGCTNLANLIRQYSISRHFSEFFWRATDFSKIIPARYPKHHMDRCNNLTPNFHTFSRDGSSASWCSQKQKEFQSQKISTYPDPGYPDRQLSKSVGPFGWTFSYCISTTSFYGLNFSHNWQIHKRNYVLMFYLYVNKYVA